MVQGDTDDYVRGQPVSITNLYKEDYRTHDEYQYRIKDKVRLRESAVCFTHAATSLGRRALTVAWARFAGAA